MLLQVLADDAVALGQDVQLEPGEAVHRRIDALALQRVVANLVGNAVR